MTNSTAVETPDLGVFAVIDLMTGYQQAALLTAAARVGVFDALKAGPSTAAALTSELGTDPATTLALLDSLAGIGLITASGAGAERTYANTPSSVRLASDGDLRLVAEKESFFAGVWQQMEATVRTGERQIESWRERLVSDPTQSLNFLRALVVLGRETGPNLTQLPGLVPGATVADLGGGLGAYAVPLAAAGARVTLADLPQVCEWAAEELAGLEEEVLDRIRLTRVELLLDGAAEALTATLPPEAEGFDIVLLSHLLHEGDDADALALLALAKQIVEPGGLVVVFELPGDPQTQMGGLDAFGPMFDLMMRIETGSRARRFAEFEALLVEAGLADVRRLDFALPAGVIAGSRAVN